MFTKKSMNGIFSDSVCLQMEKFIMSKQKRPRTLSEISTFTYFSKSTFGFYVWFLIFHSLL
jgi:hypothetical protein